MDGEREAAYWRSLMKPLRLVPLILVAALAACTTVTPEEQRRADEET